MVALTVGLHAFALDRLIKILEKLATTSGHLFRANWKIPVLMATVLAVFSSHILHIWIWALLYRGLGALPDFETALYFSTTMFTTLGLGDIVLGPQWRLLSVCEAGNGFILFGWSTAFIFEIMSKLYEREKIGRH